MLKMIWKSTEKTAIFFRKSKKLKSQTFTHLQAHSFCKVWTYSHCLDQDQGPRLKKLFPCSTQLSCQKHFRVKLLPTFKLIRFAKFEPIVFVLIKTRARGYKTFSMLNSAEHWILNAHKYKNLKTFSFFFRLSLECYFSCSLILKCQQLLAF